MEKSFYGLHKGIEHLIPQSDSDDLKLEVLHTANQQGNLSKNRLSDICSSLLPFLVPSLYTAVCICIYCVSLGPCFAAISCIAHEVIMRFL